MSGSWKPMPAEAVNSQAAVSAAAAAQAQMGGGGSAFNNFPRQARQITKNPQNMFQVRNV